MLVAPLLKGDLALVFLKILDEVFFGALDHIFSEVSD
jgi:hypothetical protein